jgi:hypothetical protein
VEPGFTSVSLWRAAAVAPEDPESNVRSITSPVDQYGGVARKP